MSDYIVVVDNLIDGFAYCGPFDSKEEAVEWAGKERSDTDWWVVELENPNA